MEDLAGRGPEATADMKARIKALRAADLDVVEYLMERFYRATSGEGFRYEYAGSDEVRQAGERSQ